MDGLKKVDQEIYQAIRDELIRQQTNLELIASENIVSSAISVDSPIVAHPGKAGKV